MNPPLQSDFPSSVPGKVAAMPNRQTPSVPISVYRELAAELQSTKATVDALKMRNDQLMQQNHQLRQEIQHFVHFSMQLGHMAGMPQASSQPIRQSENGAVMPKPSPPEAKRVAPKSPPKPSAAAKAQPSKELDDFGGPSNPAPLGGFPKMRESLYTEQPLALQRSLQSKKAGQRDFSTLWLVLSIVVIVSTAFGAGFLIMKPLMNNR
ncbi:MAG: hypothetical protein AAFX95_22415 [Cyanobacteria bacterium J06639_16]